MRKILPTFIAITTVVLAACNLEEEHTCRCYAMNANGDTVLNVTEVHTGNAKFADKKACDNDKEMYERLHPTVVCSFY